MDDLSSMLASEMLARRDAARNEVTGLIGQLVFNYSRFVTALTYALPGKTRAKN
jgi:hypothetical protein